MHLAQGTSWVVAAQNWALDYGMRMRVALGHEHDAKVPRLAFVDVDEETWRDRKNWGRWRALSRST